MHVNKLILCKKKTGDIMIMMQNSLELIKD